MYNKILSNNYYHVTTLNVRFHHNKWGGEDWDEVVNEYHALCVCV